MAKTLSSASIATSNTILAWHVTQSIDALTGTDAYDITISGSLVTSGSVGISGLLSATPGTTHQLTSSNAVTASFAASVPASGLPSGLISGSAQIATEISGAFVAPSASFSTRVAANEVVTAKTLVSSSAQISTEISGAFNAASSSFSTRVTNNATNIGNNGTNISSLTAKTGSYATTGSNSFVDSQRITGSLEVSQSKVVFNTSGSTSRNVFILDDDLAFNNNNITDGSNNQRGNLVVAYESASLYKGIAVINALTSSDVDALNYVRIGHIESGSGDHFSSQLAFTEQPLISLISEGDVLGMTISGSYGDGGNVNTGVIYFGDDGTDKMIIGSKRGSEIIFNPIMVFSQAKAHGTGSVGIGIDNSNPSAKLHVSLSSAVGTAFKAEGIATFDGSVSGSASTTSSFGHYIGDGSGLTNISSTSLPAGLLSSSAQIASDISGAFGATSASLSSRVAANEVVIAKTLVSSSAQISTEISGAFATPSASFSTRVTANEVASASFSTRVTANEVASASFSTRVAANEVVTTKTLVSSSAQIATEISGAFGAASASFSTRVSANESNISTNTTNITTLTSKTGSYTTTGSNSFNGNQQISGSLIISSSGGVKPLLVGDYVGIGDPFLVDAIPNAQLHISGSGTQTIEIESSDSSAVLKLVANGSGHAFIDLEEGSDQRWQIGNFDSDDSFRIASGSAFSNSTLFELDRSGKITVQADVSSSAVSTASFGTYIGDASYLVNIPGSSSFSTRVTANEVVTAKTLVSSSAQIATEISGAFVAPSASFSTRVTTNETNIATLTSFTGSYATTGSNQFNGNQQITGSLTLSGSLYFTSNVITTVEDGTTALDGSESLVMIDASSGNVTINLPLAASFPGKQINFKVIAEPGSYTMTLQRQGSDTIDGATTNTSLDTRWEALSVISDGSSQWLIF